MLKDQVYIYMVDTSAFYLPNEKIVYEELNELYIKRKELKKDNLKLNKKKAKNNITKDELIQLLSNEKEITGINKIVKYKKQHLMRLFKENKHITRQLDNSFLKTKNVVGMFLSNTTRVLGMKTNELSMDMIILQVFYFPILESIIQNGFEYIDDNTGEVIKYISFTASAGQIRRKKLVLIKEELYNKYEKTLMCGLTIDKINSKGGCNTNKFLAYTALNNSATEEWKKFNIDKSIVVDDMEFAVNGIVDYINYETFEINRQNMDVVIPHTDGEGIMLPRLSKTAHMIRLPFIKGLLVPFPFDVFIKEQREITGNNNIGIIKDIYGVTHDILKENIEIIFTKSQFKMKSYYNNWNDYKENFKKYNCSACICNKEQEVLNNGTISYQMLQTLTDVTNEELKIISAKTKDELVQISTNKDVTLSVLGATKKHKNKNSYQEALYLYPEMLQDEYTKETIKNKKRKMLKSAYAGKIDVGGRYSFLSTDLYAFCEFLFLGIKKPNGLLKNGEISCKLVENNIEVDVSRSPHLYREHALRTNKINEKTSKWFISNAIYTSTQDLITKVLMFDCDGDIGQIVTNKDFIKIVKRNLKNDKVVPLYYDMKSAKSNVLNKTTIYKGLESAFTGGNIGLISNDITKIWNSPTPNIECVKFLCMVNNFVIDEAKTLFTLESPDFVKEKLKDFTKYKMPKFFEYVKDKESNQVEARNNSTVNRLYNIIGKPRLNFKPMRLKKFDYTMLMSNRKFVPDTESKEYKAIIECYEKFNKNKNLNIQRQAKNYEYKDVCDYYYVQFKEELGKTINNFNFLVDTLVFMLYNIKKSKFKLALWIMFGDIILKNLKDNLADDYITGLNSDKYIFKSTNDIYCICKCCGARFLKKHKSEDMCNKCKDELSITFCKRCGKEYIKKSKNQQYCRYCAKELRKERDRIRKK